MNNSLVPFEERVTIGPRKFKLDSHFGEIDLMLELYDDDKNNQQKLKSIDFDAFNMTDRKTVEKIIKDKHLFDLNEIIQSELLTLCGTTIDAQIKAFEFLHDIYYIGKLRRLSSAQYISFIGAHRTGMPSLLKSLWNIPTQCGNCLDNCTQEM
ncbi:unnamed protein product [Rotaria sp. Silwood2]|nr:unnamed protein product [Rotaria sp. Silwood2]